MRMVFLIGFASFLILAPTTLAVQKGGPVPPPKKELTKEPTLEELVDRLQDTNFGVRFRTLSYVGSMKPYPKEIAPHVIRLLKDSNYNIRSNAANAIGNLQNALPDLGTRFPECIPQLILMLSDRDPEDKYHLVRRNAAYALGHLGASSKASIPELLKIASNKNEPAAVRSPAVQALGDIEVASPEVVDALTKLLDDPARINEFYPTIGNTASYSLGKLKTKAAASQPVLIQRLKLPNDQQRAAAADALGTVGYGSLQAENALLELLNDKNTEVQKVALSSLERINETNAFFFRNNVESREVRKKRQSLLAEIRSDPARNTRFSQLLAAQLRLGEGHHPQRARAVQYLFDLNARDQLPLIKDQFSSLEKKTVYLEWADLRMQLLKVLVEWLPANELVPFLKTLDGDTGEAPLVRFRVAVLLCKQGDKESVSHIVKQHLEKAKKVNALLTVQEIQKSLQDRQLFDPAVDIESLKIGADEVEGIHKGIQLAQHFFELQGRGAAKVLTLSKVYLENGKIGRIKFQMGARSEGWTFELRKKNGWWLPCDFRMEYIQ